MRRALPCETRSPVEYRRRLDGRPRPQRAAARISTSITHLLGSAATCVAEFLLADVSSWRAVTRPPLCTAHTRRPASCKDLDRHGLMGDGVYSSVDRGSIPRHVSSVPACCIEHSVGYQECRHRDRSPDSHAAVRVPPMIARHCNGRGPLPDQPPPPVRRGCCVVPRQAVVQATTLIA